MSCRCRLVMSIGNQKFVIPRKYQNQIGIWYFCPKFLGIFLVFYRHFENPIVKIWLNIGIFRQNKIGLVFGFCGCHFIGIGLVLVFHFPENDISSVGCRPGSPSGGVICPQALSPGVTGSYALRRRRRACRGRDLAFSRRFTSGSDWLRSMR